VPTGGPPDFVHGESFEMKERERRELATIGPSVRFLEEYGPWDGALTRQAEKLAADLQRLNTLMVTQESADIMLASDGIEIRELCTGLREGHMLGIVRLGKEVFKWAPGAGKHLKVPHARKKATTLVYAAERLAKWLRPHRRVFRAEGLAGDFLGEFKRAIRVLKARVRRNDTMMAKRKAATAAIKRELPAARRRVAVVDALLLPFLRKNPRLAVEWRLAKRVPKRQGRPSKRRLQNRRKREGGSGEPGG
jgi:hypothetical protein